MTECVVRKINDGDIAALAGLYREWDQDGRADIADSAGDFEQSFRAWYAEESGRHLSWLAEVDGRPVGFIDLAVFVRRPRPGRAMIRWGYLEGAFVRGTCRNQGIGTKLIDALHDYVTRSDIAHVMLHPTNRSIPFYERAGFEAMPADPKIRMIKAG